MEVSANNLGDWGRGDYADYRKTYEKILDEDIDAQYNDGIHRSNGRKSRNETSKERRERWEAQHREGMRKYRGYGYNGQATSLWDEEKPIGTNKVVPPPSRLSALLKRKKKR